jgi:hypothetical protein
MDIYHHGDEHERCRVTFKLMDQDGNGLITLESFKQYLDLIIGAIKKVHPGASDNLLTDNEIKILFNKISSNGKNFTFTEFENIYSKKPELLSWIDYFKNNDEEVLYFIGKTMKNLLNSQFDFYTNFSKIIETVLRNNNDNVAFAFNPICSHIDHYCKSIDKKRKDFMHSGSIFNIRTIFDNLSKPFINVDKREKNHPFEKSRSAVNFQSKESNVDKLDPVNMVHKFSKNENIFKEKEVSIVNPDDDICN